MWLPLRPYQVFLVAGIVLVMGASSFASTEKPVVITYTPETLVVAESGPRISARAYAIFDAETGKVLAAQDPKTVLPIASVTKLFTAAAVLGSGEGETEYMVHEVDVASHGRAGRLSAGEIYTAHELLFPLLLESSNDAAAVLERETNRGVVAQINEYTKVQGASTFRVTDASGLSDNNVSSAEDLAALTSALYRTSPHLFDMTQLSKRVGPYVTWTNNSPVRDETYRGGKHGFTAAANRTLVAIFDESFDKGARAVGYVILGSDDLARDTEVLRAFVAEHVSLE
jgi:D-alanyl-D-alanine carboxypeptidase